MTDLFRPNPLRHLALMATALLLAALAVMAMVATAPNADAATREGRKTIFSPEETAQMAAWLVDHANMTGYVMTAAGSGCGPTCYEGTQLWLAYYKDTVNRAARTHDCVSVTRFAPGVGGDSVPYVGVGCD